MFSINLAIILAAIVMLCAVGAWAVVHLHRDETERMKVRFEMRRLRFAVQQHKHLSDQQLAGAPRHLGGIRRPGGMN